MTVLVVMANHRVQVKPGGKILAIHESGPEGYRGTVELVFHDRQAILDFVHEIAVEIGDEPF